MNKKAESAGFTVIEMMIVIAVMAVLITLAAPSFKDSLNKRRLVGAANAVNGLLQLAREESIGRNDDINIDLSTGTNWCVGATDKSSCDCTTANDCTVQGTTRTLSYADFDNVSMTSDFTGSPAFSSPRGTVSLGGAYTYRTLTFSVNGKSIGVVVSTTGRVKLCSDDYTGDYPGC